MANVYGRSELDTPIAKIRYPHPLLSKTGTNLATRVANGGLACPELEF